MSRVCVRHPFILSENLCGRCGAEFCRECLVFPRGQKLPLCVRCAVNASGVRQNGAQSLSKREIRDRANRRRRELAETPASLPEIVNPIAAGWATEVADDVTPNRQDPKRKKDTGKQKSRSHDEAPPQHREVPPRVKPSRQTEDRDATPERPSRQRPSREKPSRRDRKDSGLESTEGDDMMAWLNNVYSTD